MVKVHYTNKAVEDLSSIWKYTSKVWSVKKADEYYNNIIIAIKRLAISPFPLGKKYFHISADLYGIKSGKHIVFYKKYPDGVIKIIRILHGSMDLPVHLK